MSLEELCTSKDRELDCDKNRIVLCEDREYYVETIKKECGIDITECLKELVDNLKSIVRSSINTKYGV